jgi:hypothetical protein
MSLPPLVSLVSFASLVWCFCRAQLPADAKGRSQESFGRSSPGGELQLSKSTRHLAAELRAAKRHSGDCKAALDRPTSGERAVPSREGALRDKPWLLVTSTSRIPRGERLRLSRERQPSSPRRAGETPSRLAHPSANLIPRGERLMPWRERSISRDLRGARSRDSRIPHGERLRSCSVQAIPPGE